ncbi:hypothetical protein CEE44_02140 [Candidatus Woesearchaeota archaeon B3_Woes]|nr:MAG: hypothetical protein CEE44_02140 [Candidatus Woesearchaeota archaeon B3_Woes]
MRGLDKTDCIILDTLQKNCRCSLTNIAKEVNLSIDSVKKRIKKMEKNKIFHPTIQLRPRNFGFVNIINTRIRLKNHTKEEKNRFIKHLEKNPRITEIFSMSGEEDLSIVVVSKNAADLDNIISEIKNKFGNIIYSWNDSTTLKVYKFESYDMGKMMGF